jgi:tRNA (guanosine-2'-O-)-methyltransferase
MKLERGHFGIGIYHGKTPENLGTLWRSAFQMGADYIFTIGARFKRQNSDTYKTYRHVPLFRFDTFEAFFEAMPFDSRLIGIEFGERSEELQFFKHPERAIYLLGAEDHGLPRSIQEKCNKLISIPSVRMPSFNVAVAGSIVMYDRIAKNRSPIPTP